MAKQQKQSRRGASRNPVARHMLVIGKVGGPHKDRRAEANRKACKGSWRAWA